MLYTPKMKNTAYFYRMSLSLCRTELGIVTVGFRNEKQYLSICTFFFILCPCSALLPLCATSCIDGCLPLMLRHVSYTVCCAWRLYKWWSFLVSNLLLLCKCLLHVCKNWWNRTECKTSELYNDVCIFFKTGMSIPSFLAQF